MKKLLFIIVSFSLYFFIGCNNKSLDNMSTEELINKIKEGYVDDIDATVEYEGTKNDFLQFVDSICNNKYYIPLDNIYPREEDSYILNFTYNFHKYSIERDYLQKYGKSFSILKLNYEYVIEYTSSNMKCNVTEHFLILKNEYKIYHDEYNKRKLLNLEGNKY